jgi:hypothetical protein
MLFLDIPEILQRLPHHKRQFNLIMTIHSVGDQNGFRRLAGISRRNNCRRRFQEKERFLGPLVAEFRDMISVVVNREFWIDRDKGCTRNSGRLRRLFCSGSSTFLVGGSFSTCCRVSERKCCGDVE